MCVLIPNVATKSEARFEAAVVAASVIFCFFLPSVNRVRFPTVEKSKLRGSLCLTLSGADRGHHLSDTWPAPAAAGHRFRNSLIWLRKDNHVEFSGGVQARSPLRGSQCKNHVNSKEEFAMSAVSSARALRSGISRPRILRSKIVRRTLSTQRQTSDRS